MGIKGLLPQLSDITTHINISSYKGYKVGVDAYVWLHQKAIGCATELCLEQPTNRYVNSFMKEVRTLLHNGVIPVIVFDGTFLPLKSRVEEERSKSRKANLKQGKKLYRQGKKSEAYQRFVKAIDITPQMAYEVMVQLKQLNIEYYVAPYEADAQLAYLYKIGSIFAVISIDSDLLVFGVHRLLTKYHQGWVKEVDLTKLNTNFSPLNFSQFSIEMFVQFCIFCGCDYLDKIPGIGPKKFHEYMLRRKKWQNVIKWILFEGKYKIPKGYEANFQRALYTFRHQRVYDPTHKRLVHLDPLPADQPDIGCDATDFLGPDMAPNIAQQIAEGIIDPFTKHIFKTNGHCNKWKKIKNKQQTNTMLSYLSNNNNKHRNSNEILLPDGTQCPSPPPPAVLVEKSFERHRETIQIISDNMDKLQRMENSNSDNIGNRKKQKANNASQHYQSLESFSFNSNPNGDNMDKLQRIGNRKKKANHFQPFNSNVNGNNNNKDINELSQTQQIDSISNRHKRKKAASQTQSNNSNGNKHYHQFKRVMPRKNIPHKNNNDNSDNLDDKMLQFAFNPNKAAKIERPSRKRRRSELLLPTKPMGSVDYNNSLSAHSDNTSITSSGYEARPHQFRPPRIKHKTKKRKLNTNYMNRKKFESPFIPKETQNLALAAGANINNINISRFAFEPLTTKPLIKRNSSSNSNASNPSTAESVASFNSDIPIATNEHNRNHSHIADTQSPQFPDSLQNTAETMESIGYISETPDVDDIDVHNANNYRASSLEMANNNNNILDDDDILTIDNELNLNAITASPIDTESNSINITDCIDLTNDDIEDNQQRQRQIVIVDDMDDDDDDIDVLDDDIDVNAIVLSDEDEENDGFDDDQRRSAMSESPLNWRRKKPRSTSPDLFDPSSPDLGMENNDDLLSQHIALQINSNHIIDITDSLNEEEEDDDDVNDINDINDIINGVCDSDDVLSDDLNIDTMPIDDVIRNPVSRQHASRYHRKQHRNKRRLQLGVVSDVSMLKENDYF